MTYFTDLRVIHDIVGRPHLRMREGLWVCQTSRPRGITGRGSTPEAAFDSWLASLRIWNAGYDS